VQRVGERAWRLPVTAFWQSHRDAAATYSALVAHWAGGPGAADSAVHGVDPLRRRRPVRRRAGRRGGGARHGVERRHRAGGVAGGGGRAGRPAAGAGAHRRGAAPSERGAAAPMSRCSTRRAPVPVERWSPSSPAPGCPG
jgi:hypothetical protein